MAEREITIGGRRLSQLKVDELKVELEKRGLKKSGNKGVLIERLQEVTYVFVRFLSGKTVDCVQIIRASLFAFVVGCCCFPSENDDFKRVVLLLPNIRPILKVFHVNTTIFSLFKRMIHRKEMKLVCM